MSVVTPIGDTARAAGTLRSPKDLRPPITGASVGRVALVVGFFGAGIFLFRYLEFAPIELITNLFKQDGYLSRALPPTFESTNSLGLDVRNEWPRTFEQLIRTLIMAWAGTGFAAVLSFPVGIAAARNTTPHPLVATAARAVIALARATPEIVIATVFVLVASIGEKAGVMALSLHSIGMLGKLLADRIEEIDEKPLESARAAGATRLQVIYNAVLPQVTPSWVNNILYRFDINLRASAVLGFVGAGGIGILLQADLKNATRYPLGMATALSLAAVIIIVELFSNLMRRRLRGAEERLSREVRDSGPTSPVITTAATPERSLRPPWTLGRVGFLGAVWGGFAAWLYSMWDVGLFTLRTLRPFGIPVPLPNMFALPISAISRISDYWPRWDTVSYVADGQVVAGWDAWFTAWRDTLTIAGGAAFMAVIFAVPAAFLMARSTTPARPVAGAGRVGLVLLRSLPDIALVFFFVSALGIQSPFPAAAAMAIGSFAFITKITADDLDGLGVGAQEALRASGATRGQEVIGAVVPSAVPMIVANVVYCFDICVRGGVLLGTIAGVGVGYLFTQTAFLPNPFQTVGAFVLSTFIVVFCIEQLSGFVRRKLL
jgi:phosphonate transport system permease protein